ncbi:MAG: hypothetical protein GC154_04250 [bacterium]|nr:hypothetical protein [bacterium]
MPLIGVLIYIAIDVFIYSTRPMPENVMAVYADTMIAGACLIAAVSIYLAAGKFDRSDINRRPWQWMSYGLALSFFGKVIYIILRQVSRFDPFPCLGDLFLLSGDLTFLWGLWIFARACLRKDFVPPYSGQIPSVAISMIALFFTSACVIVPVFSMRSDPLTERWIAILYPILDIAALSLSARLACLFWSLRQPPIARSWFILALAYVLLNTADSFHGFLEVMHLYHPYHWINLTWVIAYLLIANAGLTQIRLLTHLDETASSEIPS